MNQSALHALRVRYRHQSVAILLAMVFITGAMGWALFGVLALPLLVGVFAVGYWFGPRVSAQWVLRQRGARPLPYWQAPELHHLIQALASRAGLQRSPAAYLLAVPTPQALATGEGAQATVAVSPALLRSLPPRELTAVLAHEIAHLRGGDLRLSRLAATLGSVTRSLSSLGLIVLLMSVPLALLGEATLSIWAWLLIWTAPAVMTLSYLALSRLRELDADAAAVELTGDPEDLAQALARIERLSQPSWPAWFPIQLRPQEWEAPPWLRTHPSTDERIRRLHSLTTPSQRWRRVRPIGGSAFI